MNEPDTEDGDGCGDLPQDCSDILTPETVARLRKAYPTNDKAAPAAKLRKENVP